MKLSDTLNLLKQARVLKPKVKLLYEKMIEGRKGRPKHSDCNNDRAAQVNLAGYYNIYLTLLGFILLCLFFKIFLFKNILN